MDDTWAERIYQEMRQKGTGELQGLWKENDREQWTDQAFAVIRRILTERGAPIPAQNAPGKHANEVSLSPGDELVTLATFAAPIEAEMARMQLEKARIPGVVFDDTVWGVGVMLGEIRRVRLQVREKDAERALEILRAEAILPPSGRDGEDAATGLLGNADPRRIKRQRR